MHVVYACPHGCEGDICDVYSPGGICVIFTRDFESAYLDGSDFAEVDGLAIHDRSACRDGADHCTCDCGFFIADGNETAVIVDMFSRDQTDILVNASRAYYATVVDEYKHVADEAIFVTYGAFPILVFVFSLLYTYVVTFKSKFI